MVAEKDSWPMLFGAVTGRRLEAQASGFNTGCFRPSEEQEGFGHSRDLRLLTPTLGCTAGEETQTQRRGVICSRPHSWKGMGAGESSVRTVQPKPAKASHAAVEHPASKILSNEQVMGPVHNPGPLATPKARKAALVKSPVLTRTVPAPLLLSEFSI